MQRPGPFPGSFRKILVVGLGKLTGRAVAGAMLDLGMEVKVAERDRSRAHLEAALELEGRGAEVTFSDEDASLVDWADLVVPSPGVPPTNPLLTAAEARAVPIWSEIELGWRLAEGPVLAVTGTNGKTTTTKLLTAMLCKSSSRAVPAGNIGSPLVTAAVSEGASTVLVTEVSSFQLAYIDRFRPRIALVLNVSDDHYDWHGDFDDYLRAKARITENQQPGDLLVVSATQSAPMSIAAASVARLGVFGAEPPATLKRRAESALGREVTLAAGISGDSLVVSSPRGDVEVMRTSDIRLTGIHNLQNVLAAAAAAFDWNGSAGSIRKAVEEFEALPHRMNLVAERNGVRYIDDSKATNPHAALAALEGMTNVILIAGGRSKGISLFPLAAAAPACKAVVVMGEAAGELRKVFHQLPLREAANVEEAVVQAARIAEAGDTVLLSPGCSSLDQYEDYGERGDRFVRAVYALP